LKFSNSIDMLNVKKKRGGWGVSSGRKKNLKTTGGGRVEER